MARALGVGRAQLRSFGTSVPFQEIPDSYYKITKEEDLVMDDFDLVFIHGVFNPWHITVLYHNFLKRCLC